MFSLSRPLIVQLENVSKEIFKKLIKENYIKALVVSFEKKINSYETFLKLIKNTFRDKMVVISLEDSFHYDLNFLNFIKLFKNEISTVKIHIELILNKFYSRRDKDFEDFLKFLKKNEINIVLVIPIGLYKKKDLKPLFRILREFNIYLINLTEYPLVDIDFKYYKKFYDFFLKKVKKYKLQLIGESPLLTMLEGHSGRICTAGRLSLFINEKGNIYACKYIPILLGNFLKETLNTVWDSVEIKKIAVFPQKCKSCRFYNDCGGGCRARAFLNYNSFDYMDPLCPFI